MAGTGVDTTVYNDQTGPSNMDYGARALASWWGDSTLSMFIYPRNYVSVHL